MRRLAHWCTTHRKTVIATWVATMIVVAFGAGSVGSKFSSNFNLPSSDSQRALDLLQKRFPAQGGDSAQIVFTSRGGVKSPAVRAKMQRAFAGIQRVPHVTGVTDPYNLPAGAAISKDGRIAYATVQFDETSNELPKDDVNRVIDIAKAEDGSGLRVELGGQPIEQVSQSNGGGTEFIGLFAAIIVLLITFGSVVAMGLPVITALVALAIGIGLITVGTHAIDIADFAPQLAAMIGLGVGIDYALFIVTRFRSGIAAGLEVREAVVQSVDTSGRAVLFAGVTVMVALLGMLLMGVSFLYGVAISASLAVFFTMLASLTLLPALLAIVGGRIDSLRIPFIKRHDPERDSGFWFRWSGYVQRHPWTAALASGALLLALCIPTLGLRLGSSDAGSDPAGTTTRSAYDLLAEGFGPGFNGPFQLVAELPAKGGDAALANIRTAVASRPGVASVAPPQTNPAGNTGVIQLYPTTSPQSAATTDLLRNLRDKVLPPVERATATTVYVGGSTAIFEDFGKVLSEKLPLFIGVVVALSALLLMAVFRSVLVPLKAMVMNLLSIGAAFGVVVAVFQWGWFGSLIGIDRTGPIESFLPVMLFAIVFGLSMDYEVFLMSRIHEEWERRDDASAAVTKGLAVTGRVITAAAAIMVTVFGSFMLGDDRVIKLFGLGLSAAVLIDAVVIRSVLVPAIMQLMGRRAWWIPAWLDRILPKLSVESKHAVPSSEPLTSGETATADSDV
jgi:RND superfamily putative drug exporter